MAYLKSCNQKASYPGDAIKVFCMPALFYALGYQVNV